MTDERPSVNRGAGRGALMAVKIAGELKAMIGPH